ncbi:MAG: DUF882 domain-containing protein [Nitrospirota bacterium]
MSFFGKISRRDFLRLGALMGFLAMSEVPALAAAGKPLAPERKLSFYNTHTGENLETVYWADGKYEPEALAKINHILRDYRTEEIKSIDTKLLNMLHVIAKRLDTSGAFHVISGYRSPETNELLRKTNSGVAKNSLHIAGKAIDIRLPGRNLRSLWKAAFDLRAGGIGYYSESKFVHLDTGRVRRWGA